MCPARIRMSCTNASWWEHSGVLSQSISGVRDSVKHYHLHESVGYGRQEGGGSSGCPEVMEAGVILEAAKRRGEADRDQEELEGGVHLGDGGGLDGGRGKGGVKVLLEAEGRHHAHVANIEAGVDEERVPGHDEAGQRGWDGVGVGQSQIHTPWIQRQTIALYKVELMEIESYLRVSCLTEDPGSCRDSRPGS